MAGGIDWFRWHHGSVTDPKFQLVAKKAGVRLGDVLTIWAFLLEKASASEKRGTFGDVDCEAVDCLLDMDEGATGRVIAAMQARNLVDDGVMVAWDKRQPKRERDDPNAAERQALKRDRDNQAKPDQSSESTVTPRHATSRHVTPRNAHIRGEESREEENLLSIETPRVLAAPTASEPGEAETDYFLKQEPGAYSPPPCPHRAVLAIWAEVLPQLPQHNPDMWQGARADHLRARWRETASAKMWQTQEKGLQYFRKLFIYIGQSLFLTGRVPPREAGGRPFVVELEWILTPTKWARLHEGKYHEQQTEAPA